MKLLKLTTPKGLPVWIVAQWVTRVRATFTGEFATNAETVLSMGGTDQAVRESPEEVVRLLEASSEPAA